MHKQLGSEAAAETAKKCRANLAAGLEATLSALCPDHLVPVWSRLANSLSHQVAQDGSYPK